MKMSLGLVEDVQNLYKCVRIVLDMSNYNLFVACLRRNAKKRHYGSEVPQNLDLLVIEHGHPEDPKDHFPI